MPASGLNALSVVAFCSPFHRQCRAFEYLVARSSEARQAISSPRIRRRTGRGAHERTEIPYQQATRRRDRVCSACHLSRKVSRRSHPRHIIMTLDVNRTSGATTRRASLSAPALQADVLVETAADRYRRHLPSAIQRLHAPTVFRLSAVYRIPVQKRQHLDQARIAGVHHAANVS